MKSIKFCMIIAALCCMVPAVAQQNFGAVKYTHMCSYYWEEITGEISAFSAGPTAQTVIKKIMSVIGLKANFELREANVPNAAAVMLKGKRYILYNPNFMDNINSSAGTNWAAISILAHEIGHHLNGHTLDKVGSRPQTELDADEFSGFILHKLGASLVDAQAVMSTISSVKGSKTHPPKQDRLSYIATGWGNAGDANTPFISAPATSRLATQHKATTVAEARPVVTSAPQRNAKPVATPVKTNTAGTAREKVDESIAANASSDVYFSEDPNGEYYLTKKGNLVQVENNTLYLVSKLYKSDKGGYKTMLADQNANKIYITATGGLVNSKGHRIGYMKNH
jgi:hypothetical protein